MRMPILAYFVVIGTTLLVLLNLSSYALPDLGPPIKTSQLVGLPNVEMRPDNEATASAFMFVRPKESVDPRLPEAAYAKDEGPPKQQITHSAKKTRQAEKKRPEASRERRVAVYSHETMMNTH